MNYWGDFTKTRSVQGRLAEGDRESLKRFQLNHWDYNFRSCDIFSECKRLKITAYLKTYCGWSAGVRAVLAKYNLPYTEKDIIQNPAFRWEMETKSGQPLSPCVEINGHMLPDVSGEEVEHYLIDNKTRPTQQRGDRCFLRMRPCATEQTRRRSKAEFVIC